MSAASTSPLRLVTPVAGDKEPPLQLLRPDGTVTEESGLALDVTPELVRGLYRDMVLARRLDEEAQHLQRQGELGLWLSLRGQEAAQVGSARGLRDTDWIFPSYREHAVGLIRGVTPAQLRTQWRGCSHGGWTPAEHRMHVYDLVLATQTLHATGYAMGIRAERSDEVVLTYVGDGATSQGDTNEALNWSATVHAPVVFFCQNNQWAISTPTASQTATPLHRRATGFGLDAVYVDGNDVLAVLAATRAVVERVRSGGAPGFVEALTYRMAGHSTSDDPRRYRPDGEFEQWERRDPLARVLKLLQRREWADDRWLGNLQAESDQIAAETRSACLSLPPPRLEDTFRNTYAVETASLAAEREAFTAYRESFA
jgi:2-oxoisovalerate dehydrogenase E1 component alpha subunit